MLGKKVKVKQQTLHDTDLFGLNKVNKFAELRPHPGDLDGKGLSGAWPSGMVSACGSKGPWFDSRRRLCRDVLGKYISLPFPMALLCERHYV